MVDQILGYLMDFLRWVIIAIFSTVAPEFYAPWTGPVVAVVRPDEIRVEKSPGRVESVRLYGIDSPLQPQPFGPKALSYVSGRVLGRLVVVQPLPGGILGPWYKPTIRGYDRYHRIIALVTIDGESLNEELLKKGVARWYRPYVPFERGYKRLEDEARRANEGMWAHVNAVPSWDFQAARIYRVHPFQGTSGGQSGTRTLTDPEEAPRGDGPGKDSSGMQPSIEPTGSIPTVQEGAPDEATKNRCADDYEIKLKKAYRTIKGAAVANLYVCRQIANDWESRERLLKAYGQSGQMESESEQSLNGLNDPCPLYAPVYKDAQELWTICNQLRSLRLELAGDAAAYTERLESLSAQYNAVVSRVTLRYKW